MNTALYVIAILGCGEGDRPCEQVQLVDARYESQAACSAATEAQLMRHGDLPFPVVVAHCRQADAPSQRVMPSEILLPEPEPTPLFRTARASPQDEAG